MNMSADAAVSSAPAAAPPATPSPRGVLLADSAPAVPSPAAPVPAGPPPEPELLDPPLASPASAADDSLFAPGDAELPFAEVLEAPVVAVVAQRSGILLADVVSHLVRDFTWYDFPVPSRAVARRRWRRRLDRLIDARLLDLRGRPGPTRKKHLLAHVTPAGRTALAFFLGADLRLASLQAVLAHVQCNPDLDASLARLDARGLSVPAPAADPGLRPPALGRDVGEPLSPGRRELAVSLYSGLTAWVHNWTGAVRAARSGDARPAASPAAAPSPR